MAELAWVPERQQGTKSPHRDRPPGAVIGGRNTQLCSNHYTPGVYVLLVCPTLMDMKMRAAGTFIQ